jgi:Mrp family chromosome partitioning ATPase
MTFILVKQNKYWGLCSGLTDNTDNYSTLEPLLPNVQTTQQSLDSEPKESRVIVVTSGKGVGKTTQLLLILECLLLD